MKNAKSKLKLLLVLAALALPLCNMTAQKALNVELTNGQTVQFILQQKPVLTMDGNLLKITTQDFATSYERSSVARFFFGPATGIEEAASSGSGISITQKADNLLEITNLEKNDLVVVADLSGRQYRNAILRNGTDATVDLSSCPKGVYIIKIGNKQTIKLNKK